MARKKILLGFRDVRANDPGAIIMYSGPTTKRHNQMGSQPNATTQMELEPRLLYTGQHASSTFNDGTTTPVVLAWLK